MGVRFNHYRIETNMFLESLVIIAIALTGGSCAAIDNGTNEMVWAGTDTPLTATHYIDAGTTLIPDAPYPADVNTLLAAVHAESSLMRGTAGRKVRVSCFKTQRGVPHEVTGAPIDHNHV